jgi:hypothetical protein
MSDRCEFFERYLRQDFRYPLLSRISFGGWISHPTAAVSLGFWSRTTGWRGRSGPIPESSSPLSRTNGARTCPPSTSNCLKGRITDTMGNMLNPRLGTRAPIGGKDTYCNVSVSRCAECVENPNPLLLRRFGSPDWLLWLDKSPVARLDVEAQIRPTFLARMRLWRLFFLLVVR